MKKYHNIIESSCLLIFGFFVIVLSSQLDSSGELSLSPGLFPIMLGFCIVILAIVLLLRAIKKMKNEADTDINSEKEKIEITKNPLFKAFLLILGCFIYVFLMKYVGFIISTVAFIGFVTFLLGERSWWKILLLSVLGSLLIYAAFELGLKVYLPK